MSHPTSPDTATRDLQVDLLLERIQSNFRDLKRESIDEGQLSEDLQNLAEAVKEIGAELTTEYRWLKDLLDDVRSESGKAHFLSKLEQDNARQAETKARLQNVMRLVDGTENVVEVVYKLTASRSMLGRIEDQAHQRSMSQSLSKISVSQEKVFEGRRGLAELKGELDRRVGEYLNDTQESDDDAHGGRLMTDASLPPEDGSPPAEEANKTSSAASRKDSARSRRSGASHAPAAARTAPDPSATSSVVRATAARPSARPASSVNASSDPRRATSIATTRSRSQTTARTVGDSGATTATPSAGPCRSDVERAKRALNDWSKWDFLGPVNLGDAVRVVRASSEEATLIRIRSLVGERSWRGELSRGHSSPNLKKGESLWDLPASPPEQFASATEEGDYCETSYQPRQLHHLLYSGDVPPEILTDVTGKEVFQEDFSAHKDGLIEAGLEKRCIKALSKWSIRHEVDEHFRLPKQASGDAPSTRLIRSSIEVESIPVQRFECELDLKSGRHILLEAWLCGDEGKLYLRDVPRVWTWKTTAWLAAVAVIGVPLGLLLSSIIH